MSSEPRTTVPRMKNGPNILCLECGAISNHVSLLCPRHRLDLEVQKNPEMSRGDHAYLVWKQERQNGQA